MGSKRKSAFISPISNAIPDKLYKVVRSLRLTMALVLRILVIFSIFGIPTASFLDTTTEETVVQVQLLNRRRIRRSLSAPVVSDVTDFEYHVKINSVMGAEFSQELRLRPIQRTVFGPGFKYTTLGVNGTRVVIPSRAELDEIESKLYTHVETNTILRLEHHEQNGRLDLHGIVNGARIRSRRSADADNTHVIRNPNDQSRYLSPDVKDYILPTSKELAELGPRLGEAFDVSVRVEIEPEMVVVLDYQITQDIGGDRTQKLEYVAITVNGVNGYYEMTYDSLAIRCELVNVVEIESETKNPYHKAGSPPYDAIELVIAYGKWAAENFEELGQHDIAPILSETIFRGSNGKGTVLGIAQGAGACPSSTDDTDTSTSIILDDGANFLGIETMAHEVGHSLGAIYHDGEGNATPCLFSDGYLMSYARNGDNTNAFRFSNCSLIAIKRFALSKQGECLAPGNKTGRPIVHQSAAQAGDNGGFSAAKVCNTTTGWPVAYQEPDKWCREVICENGDVSYTQRQVVPPRNAPCGDNVQKGKCRNGYCVGQGPAVDVDTVCKIASGDPGASWAPRGPDTLHTICSQGVGGCLAKPTFWTLMFGKVAVGTPCGDCKVCFKGKCVEMASINDPARDCILGTGKEEAKQSGGTQPDGRIKCVYGTEHEYITANQDASCGVAPAPPPTEPETTGFTPNRPKHIQEACEYMTGLSGLRPSPSQSRDELCSSLKCSSPNPDDKTEAQATSRTPDGVVCGPLRRCKKGKCVTCRTRN